MGANGDVLRFTRLYLENWRNFTEVDVELAGRVFLTGPNAAGKSNLLDAFRFLHDVAAGRLDQAVTTLHRGGVSELRSIHARVHKGRPGDIVVGVNIGTTEEPDRWVYRLRFAQDTQKRPKVKQERVEHMGDVVLDRDEKEEKADPTLLTQTHLEQVNLNRKFREAAEFLRKIQYLHIVPQLVREPNRSVGVVDDPYGGDFLKQVAQTTKRTRQARLKRIRDALIIAVPNLTDLGLEWDKTTGTPHLVGRFGHWRARDKVQEEIHFSDGTLRLLGLLWALQGGTGPLLLEEPELSLHPAVIRQIPTLFSRAQRSPGRQVIVSTHSTDLLLDEGIGLDETLLLIPTSEGTQVRPATAIREAESLLKHGSTLADIAMAYTEPKNAEQLSLIDFGGGK